MAEKRAKPLYITFHNPNTQEETLRTLVHLAAQVAQARVETQLLHQKTPEQRLQDDCLAREMCVV